MTLEEFLGLIGVDVEEAKKKIGDKKIFVGEGDFVPKSRLDEEITKVKDYKSQVEEREKQINDLKASAKGNEELTKKIEEVEANNKKAREEYDAKLAQYKLDSTIDQELLSAGAKNVKAVKAVLDLTNVKFDKDGKLTGLNELIESSKKEADYLWNISKEQDKGGKKPGDGGGKGSADQWDEFRKIK